MMMKWMRESGPDSDIVLSSRIRLARNPEGVPFPAGCEDAKRAEIIDAAVKALQPAGLTVVDPASLTVGEIRALTEQHVISPAFAKDTHPRMLLTDEAMQAAVMLEEEDHIRIQTFAAGFALTEAYETAAKLDTLLDEGMRIAYSEELGYLTHCPTNLGTAMRASVMVHLPALKLSGQLPGIIRSLTQLGITVRGIYGEGSDSAGALYQISNSVTLGFTEGEILEKLDGIVRRLIESERKLRDTMKSDSYARLCDRVMRARGILRSAYILPLAEFMELWSDVRLGTAMGLLQDLDIAPLGAVMTGAMPGNLLLFCGAGEDTPEGELAILRAKYVSEHLAGECG